MLGFLTHVSDVVTGKMPIKRRRHPDWRSLRKRFVQVNPFCICCGSRRKLEVHHKIPVSENPDMERDWSNLATTCHSCHLVIGHLRSYRSFNRTFDSDAREFRLKVRNRP